MNTEIFAQNVNDYCNRKGVKPTVACAESGAGKNLFSRLMTQGTVPSVEKVQLLAQYLGCTVSDLLGERPADMGQDNVVAYAGRGSSIVRKKRLSDDQYAALVKIIESLPEE